ncbi:hypothetical protein ATANTOWER_015551 [Ataeniobius toweri]|uniref:Uncharacterized protein n=1 Tax=Ataeniobius toweri TaxID=208326 RepID=A0ABU7C8E4_9TELE|nr:hypothetical protein [Ataeniobius toweri]
MDLPALPPSFDSPSKHQRDSSACNPAPAATSPRRLRQQLLFLAIIRHPRLPRLLLRLSLNHPCFVHSVHGFSPALIIHYSASPGVRLRLCHINTSSSPLCRRSTGSLAPPTDIQSRNARPGSPLKVRCITSFSLLYFLIHMPFKHAVSHSSSTFR